MKGGEPVGAGSARLGSGRAAGSLKRREKSKAREQRDRSAHAAGQRSLATYGSSAERPRSAAETADEGMARPLLDDPDILHRIGEAMQANGYAGDRTPALLAYVALTSRLTDRPMNLAFVADSSAGKSATVDAALALMPPQAFYLFSAGSPTAILYTSAEFEHRVVVFKEADSIPKSGPAASAVRALAEDNSLRYEVTRLNRDTGKFETVQVAKQGPTGLITTGTRALRRQLNTRVLRVPVADDVDTTREVMRSKGMRAAGKAPAPPDREPFHALQRWLDGPGRRRVIVPFAGALVDLMPSPLELRMRRDFEKLLSCVKAIALLHQRRREETAEGEIIATIDDYKVAREMLLPSFDATAADGVPRAIRETVEAIDRSEKDISETDLARRLELTKQAISWRVTRALKNRWLVNDEPRSGKPYRLKRGATLPEEEPMLPEVHDVEYAVEGVPAPIANVCFFKFASALAAAEPNGVTPAEWATRVCREIVPVRERLDALCVAKLLEYDAQTDRYSLPDWVQKHIESTWTSGQTALSHWMDRETPVPSNCPTGS